MKNRSRIFLVGVLVVGFLGVMFWLRPRATEAEPVYQGKPLSYWLRGFTRDYNGSGGPGPNEAGMAVHGVGTNGLPVLLRLLTTRDTPLTDQFFLMIQRQRFIHIPYTPSSSFIMQGMEGMEALYEAGAPAVPRLMEIYEQQPNRSSREAVPMILASIGPPAKAAIPLLVRATGDPDAYVRNNAVYALGRIGGEPGVVVPALIKSLEDPFDAVRANAARMLGGLGKDAEPAIPALRKLLAREQTNTAAAGSMVTYDMMYGPGTVNKPAVFGVPINVAGPVSNALKRIEGEVGGK